MEIIRQFVEHDMAGGHKQSELHVVRNDIREQFNLWCGSDFIEMGSMPGKWILQDDGSVVYGSVTSQTKDALAYLHELYENGTIDSRFLLRKTENLDQMIADGTCGAVFGKWWAPNNPLSSTSRANESAVWKPYLLTNKKQLQTLESYKDWQYVVVRKGYEHPEIVGKCISVLFDYTRYQDRNASEINDYFSLNVDPTARPMNINVDYWDALYRTTEHIQQALDGTIKVNSLTGIEKAYYQTCKSYMKGYLTTATAWASYASRMQAVPLLANQNQDEETSHCLWEMQMEKFRSHCRNWNRQHFYRLSVEKSHSRILTNLFRNGIVLEGTN